MLPPRAAPQQIVGPASVAAPITPEPRYEAETPVEAPQQVSVGSQWVPIEGSRVVELIEGPIGPIGPPGKNADEEAIVNRILAAIPRPADGKDAVVDYPRIVKEVTGRMPKQVDPKDIVRAVVAQLPPSGVNAVEAAEIAQQEIGQVIGSLKPRDIVSIDRATGVRTVLGTLDLQGDGDIEIKFSPGSLPSLGGSGIDRDDVQELVAQALAERPTETAGVDRRQVENLIAAALESYSSSLTAKMRRVK